MEFPNFAQHSEESFLHPTPVALADILCTSTAQDFEFANF